MAVDEVIVRGVEPKEVELWCQCPLEEGEPGYAEWVAGERAWVAQYHPTTQNLFLAEVNGQIVGKYDVPMASPKHWTLWAPTVRHALKAPDAMFALCQHIMSEAATRCIPVVEVLLEESHGAIELARAELRNARLVHDETKVLVRRDFDRPLPEMPDGVTIRPATEFSADALRSLAALAGMAADDIEAFDEKAPPIELGVVAMDGDTPVGLALAESAPGDTPLGEKHIGVIPEARNRGLGYALLLACLRRGHEAGAEHYIGSTAKSNPAMLRVFEKLGCRPMGTRYVYKGRPRPVAIG